VQYVRRVRAFVLAVLAAFLSACVNPAESQVSAIYAAEASCPRSQIQVVEVGTNSFVVAGCGFRQLYTCFGITCQPNGSRQPLPGNTPRVPAPVAMAPVMAPGWTPGARVTVQAADGSKFNAVLDQVSGEQVSVTMPNGLHQWVPKSAVSPQP
jgi:hypothetical protein